MGPGGASQLDRETDGVYRELSGQPEAELD